MSQLAWWDVSLTLPFIVVESINVTWLRRSLRWMSSRISTYLLQQEKKDNKWWKVQLCYVKILLGIFDLIFSAVRHIFKIKKDNPESHSQQSFLCQDRNIQSPKKLERFLVCTTFTDYKVAQFLRRSLNRIGSPIQILSGGFMRSLLQNLKVSKKDKNGV